MLFLSHFKRQNFVTLAFYLGIILVVAIVSVQSASAAHLVGNG
jgi:hypothetical protein